MSTAQAGIGHNSAVVKKELEGFVKRVEKLIEDRVAVNDDIKEVMEQAALKGFDKRTMREMIRLRALDGEKRALQEELREMYTSALGM
jgi:uncharacterized protein (UPF0335 family)